MELNQLSEEIHACAKAKGWWDPAKSDLDCYALFHSEISEAVEEMRNPELTPELLGLYCLDPEAVVPLQPYELGFKPEGVAVEVADAVIRILDYMAYKAYPCREVRTVTLPEEILKGLAPFSEMHRALSNASYYALNLNYPLKGQPLDNFKMQEINSLSTAMDYMISYVNQRGWDFDRVIRIKMDFNATRSHRHGGKNF